MFKHKPVKANEVLAQFAELLPFDDSFTPVEYIWIDGSGQNLRSKTKIYNKKITSVDELEEWNYDGSSCYQATTDNSEIILKPVAIFRDPFRKPSGLLALCETYKPDGSPARANYRTVCNQVMSDAAGEKPMFGIEQEYVILEAHGSRHKPLLHWPHGGYPAKQGPYYCSVGASVAYGRELVEMHMMACMYAGLDFAGINAEVLPSQWEFQIGVCNGIDAGDQLWIARYLLHRCAESFGWDVTFDPKPVPGEWNGSGGHTNFSTEKMRASGGITEIEAAIHRLGKNHLEHMSVYGDGNERRLTGKCETSSINKFSYGIADRGASIRIPSTVAKKGCGYLEDRRPAASLDPYLVTAMMVDTICLGSKYSKQIRQEVVDSIANKVGKPSPKSKEKNESPKSYEDSPSSTVEDLDEEDLRKPVPELPAL